jgi:hypothetical protein
MFSPLIVSPIPPGYAIVDGQHHTVSAMLRGHTQVPCMVVEADHVKQAKMFAAVNGTVTAMSPLQLYHARLASGDEATAQFHKVLTVCGVSVCKYPLAQRFMKSGDTLSAAQLARLYKQYGTEIFGNALCCITKTRDGNIGMLRGHIVRAICLAIDARPHWRGQALINAMQLFDLRAEERRARHDGEGVADQTDRLAKAIIAHLNATFRVAA